MTTMGDNAAEIEFHKLIQVLARVSSFDLDENILEQYDKTLSEEFHYEEMIPALQDLISERDTKDAFPSIRAIREKIRPSLDEKSAATLIANDIIAAISKKGRQWARGFDQKKFASFHDCMSDEFGDLGALVVQRMGGWGKVCEVDTRQVPFLKKQIVDTAMAVINSAKHNQLDWKPSVNDFLPERAKRTKHLPGSSRMDRMLPEDD